MKAIDMSVKMTYTIITETNKIQPKGQEVKIMTKEHRMQIAERIDKMVGSREHQREITANMNLEDRIRSNNRYNKMRETLFKLVEKYGERALICTTIQCGAEATGVTAKGKNFVWQGNNGLEERSRYCGSLWIEGIGTVFTSGTLVKVYEYILNN